MCHVRYKRVLSGPSWKTPAEVVKEDQQRKCTIMATHRFVHLQQ
jgi:hypothetical protein